VGSIDGQVSNRFEIALREFEKAASLPISGEPSEKLLTFVSASKLTMKDQLLVLIKDSSASSSTDKSKTNLQVQRALNKVGYGPVKEDGVYGATTKAAIELFEKNHKLAVRGEPNGRVLKELAAASGIAVE
jgi:peptidoglycan hydrolase-like protein with peptidoglycan-binding domain